MTVTLLRIGTRVRTIDRGARVHGRSPDKPEAVGIIRDHHRPYGRQSKDRTPPYYVTFKTGEAAWYDAAEVEPVRGAHTSIKSSGHHATKKSPAQLEREISEALAGRSPHSTKRSPGARGDPLATAAGVVTDRVRASEAYRLGQEEVVRAALRTIGPSPSVARLRELGGLTEIVRGKIDRARTPDLDRDLGSPMFPLTPRLQLARDAGVLRTRVQQILAA